MSYFRTNRRLSALENSVKTLLAENEILRESAKEICEEISLPSYQRLCERVFSLEKSNSMLAESAGDPVLGTPTLVSRVDSLERANREVLDGPIKPAGATTRDLCNRLTVTEKALELDQNGQSTALRVLGDEISGVNTRLWDTVNDIRAVLGMGGGATARQSALVGRVEKAESALISSELSNHSTNTYRITQQGQSLDRLFRKVNDLEGGKFPERGQRQMVQAIVDKLDAGGGITVHRAFVNDEEVTGLDLTHDLSEVRPVELVRLQERLERLEAAPTPVSRIHLVERLEKIEARLGGLDRNTDSQEGRLEKIKARLGGLDHKSDIHQENLMALDGDADRRFEALEKEREHLTQNVFKIVKCLGGFTSDPTELQIARTVRRMEVTLRRLTQPDIDHRLTNLSCNFAGIPTEVRVSRQEVTDLQRAVDELREDVGMRWKTIDGHRVTTKSMSTSHLRNLLRGTWGCGKFREECRTELDRRECDAKWKAKDGIPSEDQIADAVNQVRKHGLVIDEKIQREMIARLAHQAIAKVISAGGIVKIADQFVKPGPENLKGAPKSMPEPEMGAQKFMAQCKLDGMTGRRKPPAWVRQSGQLDHHIDMCARLSRVETIDSLTQHLWSLKRGLRDTNTLGEAIKAAGVPSAAEQEEARQAILSNNGAARLVLRRQVEEAIDLYAMHQKSRSGTIESLLGLFEDE